MSLETGEIFAPQAVHKGGEKTHLILRRWKAYVLLQLLHP